MMKDTVHAGRGTRRRMTAVTGCTTLVVVMGGGLLAPPAAFADDRPGITIPPISAPPVISTGTISILPGGGGGVVSTGNPGGVVGVDLSGGGVGVGVPEVTTTGTTAAGPGIPTVVTSPSTGTSPIQVPAAGDGSSVGSGTGASAPADGSSTGTGTSTSTSTGTSADGSTTSTGATASGAALSLSKLVLTKTSTLVYPVKDGYRDTVRFTVAGLTAAEDGVAVTGSAVLTRAGRTVKTWKVDGEQSVLTWNGRVASEVQAGTYRFTATALSADGTRRTATTSVKVLPQHLERRVVGVTTKVAATSVTAKMPARLIKAFEMGSVSVRVKTVADVRGTARLRFSNNGVTRTIPLKDGTNVTRALVVPKGFQQVRITHVWKRGAAALKRLTVRWSYNRLV